MLAEGAFARHLWKYTSFNGSDGYNAANFDVCVGF